MMNIFTNNRLLLSALFLTVNLAGVLAQKPAAPPAKVPAKPPATTTKPVATPGKTPQKPAPAPVKSAAPAPPRDSNVLKLFDKNTVKWQKTYKGRFDDAAVVEVSLGYDGKICRGFLVYPQSNTRIRLEGKMDTSGFKLEERNDNQRVSGYISGRIQGKSLTAEWNNSDNSLGGRIEAEEVPLQAPVNCSDNKWSSRYITRYNNARCDMVLVRAQGGILDGFMWIESDGETYRLKGEIKPDGTYELDALGEADRLVAIISGEFKAGQGTVCRWTGSGEKREFKFILKDHFQMGCYDYADYNASFDVLHPHTVCEPCNTWLDEQVRQWLEKCKSVFESQNLKQTPETRNVQRASAWPEITCWTDNLLSGYLTFSDTRSSETQGIAYNFDLKNGKLINPEDLFVKSFSYKNWFSDFANKEMPKLPSFAADPQFRSWLVEEGFPLMVIRREGFELSTLFHPFYGRQTLFIPYSSIRNSLRKDGPLGEFVK